MWHQHTIQLRPRARGFHLITDEIEQQLPQIKRLNVGLLHLFVQHTSASLTINENADPTVRQDMEAHFNHAAPEGRLIIGTLMRAMMICPRISSLHYLDVASVFPFNKAG